MNELQRAEIMAWIALHDAKSMAASAVKNDLYPDEIDRYLLTVDRLRTKHEAALKALMEARKCN